LEAADHIEAPCPRQWRRHAVIWQFSEHFQRPRWA
jgi:hypothetical protein